MGSGVGTLGRKIRLAMTVMVESRIGHYSYSYHRDHILDQVIFIGETIFILECACLGTPLNTLIFVRNCIVQQSTICKITKSSTHQAQS